MLPFGRRSLDILIYLAECPGEVVAEKRILGSWLFEEW
jgi:DNA-binding winged helix-turn-helix (wHTH) protein